MQDVVDFLIAAWGAVSVSAAYLALTSDQALRAYALAGVFLASAWAVWTAMKPLRGLHQETKLEHLLARLRIPGPRPTRRQSIEAQMERKLSEAECYAATTSARIGLTFLLGVAVPFSAILLVTACGDWFFPTMPVLVDIASQTAIHHPSAAQLGTFALDLFLKGGLNDVIEVFELDIGTVRHAASNLPYAGLILLFRFVADLFVVSLVFYALRTGYNWRQAARQVMREAQLQAPPVETSETLASA